ncbi:hypothetical protein DNK47_02305 [Mycoplasma wenyonii]|uniref:Uncharacterized protein n=1 Tax=Mycoplasma wenyonii TaxID=65123 RepID=A0A328PIP6_9MOLU|nr:hypothetical protein [Mycoplasma wenyonii]RAO94953.1 hypothetical protein DNK47_02305 [Mycoplasma wenyonii]
MCVRKDGKPEPTFFYYDRSQEKSKRIKQVETISGGSSGRYSRTVTIEYEGGSKPLYYAPPQWNRYWKGKKIKPESQCKVTKGSATSFNTLTCNLESSSNAWTQEIPAIL